MGVDRPTGVARRRDAPAVRHTVPFALAVWAVWRVCVAVVGLATGTGVEGPLFHYDGAHFLWIARHGYWVHSPADLHHAAFFPLVPWTAAALSWVTFMPVRTAAVVVANTTGLLCFVLLYELVRRSFDVRRARSATVALAVFPTSFFLCMFYSDGALLALVLATGIVVSGSSTGARRIAALFALGVATALSRSVGVALAAAVLLGTRTRRQAIRDAIASATGGLLGFGIVCAVQRHETGYWLAFAHAERRFDRSLSPPWVAVYRAVRHIADRLPGIAAFSVYDLVFAGLATAAAMVATARWWWSRRAARFAIAWGWLAVIFPLCTGVIESMSRFVLVSVPLYLDVDVVKGRLLRSGLAVTSAAFGAYLCVRFAHYQPVD